MNRTTYGLDLAKSVMQLHWVDAGTGEIQRKKLSRAKLVDYFASLKSVRIVMKACGSVHHWARVPGAHGHQVELLPSEQVKPFVRTHKNDAADARATWVDSQQDDIRRVPLKRCEQQAAMALRRTRAHWVNVHMATINALRGLLYEFGFVLHGGRTAGLKALAQQRAEIGVQLPEVVRGLVAGQLQMLAQLQQHRRIGAPTRSTARAARQSAQAA